MKKQFFRIIACVLTLVFALGSFAQAEVKENLVYAQSIAITSLDPAGMQPQGYPSGYEAAFAIHNGLIRFDGELQFTPDLAESWETSENGLEWTFKLRQGVVFHDGTPFNADAVVAHFTRMIDNTINIGAYSLWSPIVSTEKVDEYTVKVTTSSPYSAFMNVMAHGSALIPSPTAVEKDPEGYGLHPVGTGYYKVEHFEPGTELVLTANESYYEGAPEHKTVTFRYVGDASARVSALLSGQADVIDSVPAEFTAQLTGNPQVEVIAKPGLQVFGVGLNQLSPLLQDKAVRQALNYAIDKDAIAKILFMGYATPLTSPLARNTTGSVAMEPYAIDVEKAKQMLTEAGWVDGADGIREKDGQKLALTLITPEGMYAKDVILCETIQSQLAAVGVSVTINKVEKAVYWDQLKVPADSATYDMALWGYNPSHGNGQIHLESLFTANASKTENPSLWNFIWYDNPRVTELLNRAKEEVDPQAFNASMQEAQELIWDDCPYIWLYSNNIISAKRVDAGAVTVLPVVFTLIHR